MVPDIRWRLRIAHRLRETGPCLMCGLDLHSKSVGAARDDVLRDGRDPGELRRFAMRTHRHWAWTVCGRCAGRPTDARCRVHFCRDVHEGATVDADAQRALLDRIMERLSVYSQSFVWDHGGIETDVDRAALIGAVGWCSGWRGLLTVLPQRVT